MNHAIIHDNQEGSLRITEHDLLRLGYKSKKIVIPSNSLLIANVGGFHRRSNHNNDVCRYAVHGSIRPIKIFDSDIYSK